MKVAIQKQKCYVNVFSFQYNIRYTNIDLICGNIWDWIGKWWGKVCKHNYASVVTALTCTNKGYTTHRCAKCGASYKDTYTSALGHTWDAGEVTEETTCTENGLKKFTCVTCGEEKTEVIKATGHDYKNGVCGNQAL